MGSRILPLFSGLVIGVVLGIVLMQVAAPPLTGTSVPSSGVTTATGCAEPDDRRPWVGQVPNPDYRAVYLMNYSVIHDTPDVEVRADLSEPNPDAWLLAVTTMPADTDKAVSEDCQPRTTLDAAVALPTSADSLQITIDGEPVVTVETTSNAPRFRYLEA
jgi:hypothetical protein